MLLISSTRLWIRGRGLAELGIGIAHLGEIGRARPRVEFGEQGIVERRGLDPADPARGIVDVAKENRAARASRLAGGHDLAVGQAPIGFFRLDARIGDALNAVGAFLHDAAHAHRDFRIALRLEALGILVAVLQEIEAAHLVGTVVRAKSRADAAVVDLQVESLGIVDRRFDRADDLAGRLLAMHAGYGLKMGARLLCLAFVVAIDADPMHFASAQYFLLADHRNVVLRLAGDRAGAAAGAGIEVDAHRPGIAVARHGFVHAGARP